MTVFQRREEAASFAGLGKRAPFKRRRPLRGWRRGRSYTAAFITMGPMNSTFAGEDNECQQNRTICRDRDV